MKRLIIITLASFISLCHASAQNINELNIKDYTLELDDDGYLNLDIDIDLSRLKIRNTQVVVLTPAVINGADTLMLKSIGVYGRNRRIFYLRNEEEKPTGVEDINLSVSQASENIGYDASVAFMDWMDGCKVELIRTDYGCCGESAIISREELVDRFPLKPYFPELIYLRPKHEVVKTREISGSAFVDFPVSQTVIDTSYRNNTVELAKITGTIDSVKRNQDITIKSIFIKGFASPESPYANNTRLAKGRTEALKEYVEGLYHFGEGFIKTDFEPEDWAGLEKYVMESSLQHKDEILEAIRSDRDPDTRE
jgi:outer membrane protein OmpA-like peptidoglycan-associated protein